MDVKARLDDTWVDQFGLGYSEPDYSTSFGETGGGGCEEASFVLGAPAGYRHRALREGALLRLYCGGVPVFAGLVDGIDRDTWVIHARGLAKQAVNALALDTGYVTTTVLNDAIDFAISTGAVPGWVRDLDAPDPYGATSTTDGSNTLAVLADGVAQQAGKWWTVWADQRVRLESVPTTPSYYMVPKSVDLPVSYEEYASRLVGRYYDSATHVASTALATDADAWAAYPKEAHVDMLPLGEIDAANALSIVEGGIAQGKSKPGYTASVEVSRWQLLNRNFAPVDRRLVRAGRLVRIPGVRNDAAGTPYHDWVIGRTKITGRESTLVMDPMGLVTNGSQEDVIAKILGAAWDEKFKA